MKKKFKSIKLWVFIIQFVISIIMVFTGFLSGRDWVNFQKFITGFYFVGNVTSKYFRPEIDFNKYLERDV